MNDIEQPFQSQGVPMEWIHFPITNTPSSGETMAFKLLAGNTGTNEIVRITKDGRVFWKEREVETDSDFRGAMMDLVKHWIGR